MDPAQRCVKRIHPVKRRCFIIPGISLMMRPYQISELKQELIRLRKRNTDLRATNSDLADEIGQLQNKKPEVGDSGLLLTLVQVCVTFLVSIAIFNPSCLPHPRHRLCRFSPFLPTS